MAVQTSFDGHPFPQSVFDYDDVVLAGYVYSFWSSHDTSNHCFVAHVKNYR